MKAVSRILIFSVLIIGMVGIANAERIPDWIKNTAGWWATDAISETEFVNAIEYLVSTGIIKTNTTVNSNLDDFCSQNKIIPHLTESYRNILCSNMNISYIYSPVEFVTGIIEYNEKGFRGNNFSFEKPKNVYRIFTVGGSTTEGVSPIDDETYPGFLQKIFEENDLNNVEVINAGVSGASSFEEVKLIENKLLNYDPDMIIIYDGWNDLRTYLGEPEGVNVERTPDPIKSNPETWMERWKDFCINNSKDVKTIIILQPLLGFSDRILTNQEYGIYIKYFNMIDTDIPFYDEYAEKLKELSSFCTDVKDFRNIYDNSDKNIYRDTGHVGTVGEKILAKNIYNVILPHIVDKKIEPDFKFLDISTIKESSISLEKDSRAINFIEKSFNNLDLSEQIFWFGAFDVVQFTNNSMNDLDFTFSKMNNVTFKENDLIDSKFGRTFLSKISFLDNNQIQSDFSGAIIQNTLFENNKMSKTKFLGSIIDTTLFKNTDLSNSVISLSHIYRAEFHQNEVTNLEIKDSDFVFVKFIDFDFSEISSKNNSFAATDFRNTNINEINNWELDFTSKTITKDGRNEFYQGSNLSNQNLSGIDFSNTTFSYEDAPVTQDLEEILHYQNLAVTISNSNLSNTNFSYKNLKYIDFSSSDFKNSDLSFADLRYANLEGANLEGANLEGANLEGANLEGANLSCHNHNKCIRN